MRLADNRIRIMIMDNSTKRIRVLYIYPEGNLSEQAKITCKDGLSLFHQAGMIDIQSKSCYNDIEAVCQFIDEEKPDACIIFSDDLADRLINGFIKEAEEAPCSNFFNIPFFSISGSYEPIVKHLQAYHIAGQKDDSSQISEFYSRSRINFFPMIPSYNLSSFLLAKSIFENIEIKKQKPEDTNILGFFMQEKESGKKRPDIFKEMCACFSKNETFPVSLFSFDDNSFDDALKKAQEPLKNADYIVFFYYGPNYTDYIRKIREKCPNDATLVLDSNMPDNMPKDFNYIIYGIKPKSAPIVFGQKLFSHLFCLALEITYKSYNATNGNDLLEWIRRQRFLSTHIGDVLFRRNDGHICYPIWIHYKDKDNETNDYPYCSDYRNTKNISPVVMGEHLSEINIKIEDKVSEIISLQQTQEENSLNELVDISLRELNSIWNDIISAYSFAFSSNNNAFFHSPSSEPPEKKSKKLKFLFNIAQHLEDLKQANPLFSPLGVYQINIGVFDRQDNDTMRFYFKRTQSEDLKPLERFLLLEHWASKKQKPSDDQALYYSTGFAFFQSAKHSTLSEWCADCLPYRWRTDWFAEFYRVFCRRQQWMVR